MEKPEEQFSSVTLVVFAFCSTHARGKYNFHHKRIYFNAACT